MLRVSDVQKELKALGCNEKVTTDLLVACGILEGESKKPIKLIITDVFWDSDGSGITYPIAHQDWTKFLNKPCMKMTLEWEE